MPFNSVSETKKEIVKTKFNFSLKRHNATNLTNENTILKSKEDLKPNGKLGKALDSDNKENKPVKRPFQSTYLNTLHNSKKLKTISGVTKVAEVTQEAELIIIGDKLPSAAMLNGHHQTDTQYGGNGAPTKKTPIATLSNLGNTCFLNSVLYTLRYAPRFLHNLHHLVSDLSMVEQKLGSIRLKSSSLGRSATGLASSGTRSWSSKDLLSLGQSDTSTGKSKIQLATERLHETYASLRAAETKCINSSSVDASPEPYAADAFLCALREVNSTFEGNRQQDAHELLICILNNIRETCRALSARATRLQVHENGESNGLGRQPSLDGDGGGGGVKPTLGNLRKSWKKRKDVSESPPAADRAPSPAADEDEATRPGRDFVADDFEGTMVMRTTCLECETVTERSQAMCDVCVPVADEGDAPPPDPREPFRAAANTTELLRDQNKYWCSVCLRYVEARRCVGYTRLPRLLVLQLKRFSGGMTKITRHAPTPRSMPCWCEPCAKDKDTPQHRYNLWAVIMHLGQSLSGGHYVAYARASPGEHKCCRESTGDSAGNTGNTSSSFMRALFNRTSKQTNRCQAKECCVPRPRQEECWLACDDELVKPITTEEFEDLLSAEPKMRSAATPYLLFYVKNEIG